MEYDGEPVPDQGLEDGLEGDSYDDTFWHVFVFIGEIFDGDYATHSEKSHGDADVADVVTRRR